MPPKTHAGSMQESAALWTQTSVSTWSSQEAMMQKEGERRKDRKALQKKNVGTPACNSSLERISAAGVLLKKKPEPAGKIMRIHRSGWDQCLQKAIQGDQAQSFPHVSTQQEYIESLKRREPLADAKSACFIPELLSPLY